MITAKQIRAARALLDISQTEAAQQAGISLSTLSKTEKGDSAPAHDTAQKLQDFYEGSGIEFLPQDGVRFMTGDRVYRGPHGIRRFFDEVYEAARHGQDIALFNGSPALLLHWLGEDFYAMHAARMNTIGGRFAFRIIVKEGERNFIASTFAQYRWFPEALFNERTIYMLGDRVGFFTFSDDDVEIRVMEGAQLAASMRVLFDIAWTEVAQVPA